MNRLTFGSEKDKLRMVVENGVDASDARVMTRTNEATQLILAMRDPQTHEPLIPVNGMMLAQVDVVNNYFDLPPEMESAIHVEQNQEAGVVSPVNGQTDVRQGFYNIVNPFTYMDPSMAYDNPFTDYWLQPSQTDTSKLVRRYWYNGFENGRVLVIGPKAYIPITVDEDYLIVQNVPALKRMIQSVEYTENNQFDDGQKLYDQSRDIIIGEIKKHQMDPRFIMSRKGGYEDDLVRFQQGSMGWTRARLALTVPGALMLGKEDIRRIIDDAQSRMLVAGDFKGCLEEFNASITDGHVYFPSRVETVIAASLDGLPIDIRSIFYKYIKGGVSRCSCSCSGGRLEDEGERFFPTSGTRRRVYRAFVGTSSSEVVAVCKLRWEPKEPEDQLTITNFEANRVMATAILLERQEKWAEAAAAIQTVLGPNGILQRELREYLNGIHQIFPRLATGSLAGLGRVL